MKTPAPKISHAFLAGVLFVLALPPPGARAAQAAAEIQSSPEEITRLLAKGRSQYLAGDPAGARETFDRILALEPDNSGARAFLERLAPPAAPSSGDRERTTAQMVREVGQSWQRPRVYPERDREGEARAGTTPLEEKLNRIVLPGVNFNGVELSRVASALGAISEEYDPDLSGPKGINFVLLDPAGKNPAVSITLRNLSLKRVLDFITGAVGYQYEIQADAVVIRPGGETSALGTAFFPITRATVIRLTGKTGRPAEAPVAGAGPASPGDGGGEAAMLRGFLQQAGVNFDGTPGSSAAYDGSALIVTQTARNLERIRNILNRYHDVRQVEIEAKFVEVQQGDLNELGVDWSVSRGGNRRNPLDPNNPADQLYRSTGRSIESAFAAGTNAGGMVSVSRPAQEGLDALNLNQPLKPPSFPGGVDLGVGALPLGLIATGLDHFAVNAMIRALARKSGTDLLSAPKVTVLSGHPATITVAQELRYPKSFGQIQSQVGTGNNSGGGSAGVAITAGTPQEFDTRNIGVELKVTPTVEDDNESISLDLNPRVTEFEGFVEYGGPSIAISGGTTVTVPSGFFQPVFSTREVTTKVTLWDGATLVMGGLTREDVKKVTDKVPILGDVPLLGRLFRSQGESTQKRNLLIFVTANLVSPGGAPSRQRVGEIAPGALFRNPALVTPGGPAPRTEAE